MRCLYCGKELALLKRLTGGGDFCSDAHKQSYQEEYNRLALSRLLQAQNKGQQSNSPAPNMPPPARASVAVEEPLLQGEPDIPANTSPEREEALVEARTEILTEAELGADPVPEEDSSAEVLDAEPEPVEPAGFLLDSPAVAPPLTQQIPYLETWLEPSAGPAMSDWQFQSGTFTLSPADLLSLDLRANASPIKEQTLSPDSSPQTFTNTQPDSSLSAVVSAKKIANTNRLPASSSIDIDIAPSLGPFTANPGPLQAVAFESFVLFDDSKLLELSPTDIDFPAEDADVVVAAGSHSGAIALAPPETEPPAHETGTEDPSPRESLEALSRLHRELAGEDTTLIEEAPSGSGDEPNQAIPAVDTANSVPEEAIKPEVVSDAGPAPEPEIAEAAAEQPQTPEEALEPEASKSKFATELFELSIKTFPPGKPALVAGQPFPSNTAPLLPHLKSLPLRPKVALATGYVPQAAATPTDAKPAMQSGTPARTSSPSKPGSSAKPSARLTQPKQPPSAKPAQAATKAPEPRIASSAKTAAPRTDAAKQDAKPVTSQAAPVHETTPARASVSEVTPKAKPAEKDASKPAPVAEIAKPVKPAADTAKPAVDVAKPAPATAKPAAARVKPTADESKQDDVPHFGIAQPSSASGFGSLKVKLGLAILILVIACIYFLGWGGGGKSNKPASANPALSADGAGPSIILGEGGWVEGWGGDPTGLHGGRQITIYRPSLKLADYRLEFQGTIDAKSLGWVFRASDPDNYYAMKLMTVSSGLSTKVALFKYLIANGKQTQVGRVPIDLAVQADTAFAVRLDVRGPQFTTYIQGQQVDNWTDDQLKTGGAGFLNEREERGKVKSVSIRYLTAAK